MEDYYNRKFHENFEILNKEIDQIYNDSERKFISE